MSVAGWPVETAAEVLERLEGCLPEVSCPMEVERDGEPYYATLAPQAILDGRAFTLPPLFDYHSDVRRTSLSLALIVASYDSLYLPTEERHPKSASALRLFAGMFGFDAVDGKKSLVVFWVFEIGI